MEMGFLTQTTARSGFAAIVLETLEQNKFKKVWKRTREMLGGPHMDRNGKQKEKPISQQHWTWEKMACKEVAQEPSSPLSMGPASL